MWHCYCLAFPYHFVSCLAFLQCPIPMPLRNCVRDDLTLILKWVPLVPSLAGLGAMIRMSSGVFRLPQLLQWNLCNRKCGLFLCHVFQEHVLKHIAHCCVSALLNVSLHRCSIGPYVLPPSDSTQRFVHFASPWGYEGVIRKFRWRLSLHPRRFLCMYPWLRSQNSS